MAERELRPVGRYEWEQIVRRARFGGVIGASGKTGADGRPTRGGISGTLFKAIALGWATYADDKGADIYAGDATVAVDLETTIKAVRTVRQALLDLGLLKHVRGRRWDHGEEYRLTLPSDLLDVLDVPTPAQHKLAARALRDAARGKRGGSSGPPNDDGPGSPADHPEPVENPDLGGPEDTPDEPDGEEPGWSSGPARDASGWSAGPALGGPADPLTDHDRTNEDLTDHRKADLRTAVTVVGPPQATQDQISPGCRDPGCAKGYILVDDNLARCPTCHPPAVAA
jgi:hypothetical protein